MTRAQRIDTAVTEPPIEGTTTKEETKLALQRKTIQHGLTGFKHIALTTTKRLAQAKSPIPSRHLESFQTSCARAPTLPPAHWLLCHMVRYFFVEFEFPTPI